MNKIKDLREKKGFTQVDLAEKSGLSLRTIQRLEAGRNKPKGHSLQVLSKVFDVEPVSLLGDSLDIKEKVENQNSDQAQNQYQIEDQIEVHNDDQLAIQLINLSALIFILLPFGNIILPFILWKKKRSSKTVDKAGRRILNYQILWSLVFYFSLCCAPWINWSPFDSIPLILAVLVVGYIFNLVVILYTANKIKSKATDFLNIPFQVI